MADPRQRVADLMRLALDGGASEAEQRTAAMTAVKLIAAKDLFSAEPSTKPHAAANEEGTFDGFRSSLERQIVVEAARQTQKQDDVAACKVAGTEAYSAVCNLPLDLRRSRIGQHLFSVVSSLIALHAGALTPERPAAGPKLDKALDDLGELLMDRHVLRASDRKESLFEMLDGLFQSNGELPGADVIAKMVGIRASDVRRGLKSLIECGHVEAIGQGRSRRYRWIAAKDRPDADAESRPKSGRDSDASSQGKAKTSSRRRTRKSKG